MYAKYAEIVLLVIVLSLPVELIAVKLEPNPHSRILKYAFPNVAIYDTASAYHEIFFGCDVTPCKVWITIGNDTTNVTVTSPQFLRLNNTHSNDNFQQLQFPTVIVESDREMFLYGMMTDKKTSSGYLGIPAYHSGTDYVVLSHKITGWHSALVITAVEQPKTNATIFFSGNYTYNNVTYNKNFPMLVKLGINESKTFWLEFDPTGTFVSSTGQILVVAGPQCDPLYKLRCHQSSAFIPPVQMWGYSYNLFTQYGQISSQLVRIISAFDKVNLNIVMGSENSSVILDRLEYYDLPLDRGKDVLVTIQSKKPILVLQVFGIDEPEREPESSFNIIPPINLALPAKIVIPRFTSVKTVMFTIPSTASLKINGHATLSGSTIQNQTNVFVVDLQNSINTISHVNESVGVFAFVVGQVETHAGIFNYPAFHNFSDTYVVCPFEIIGSAPRLTFMTSLLKDRVYSLEFCPKNGLNENRSIATRECHIDGWSEARMNKCNFTDVDEEIHFILKVESLFSPQQISQALEEAVSNITSFSSDTVEESLTILVSVTRKRVSPQSASSVVQIVSQLMDTNVSVIGPDDSDLVLNSLENMTISIAEQKMSVNIQFPNLAVSVKSMESIMWKRVTFAYLLPDKEQFQDGSPMVILNDEETPVMGNSTVTLSFDNFQNGLHVSFIIFQNDRLFLPNEDLDEDSDDTSREEICGHVISAAMENLSYNDSIKTLLQFTSCKMQLKPYEIITGRRCVFWNESHRQWSSEGCKVHINSSTEMEGVTMCECTHLTSFAVILSIQGDVSFKAFDIVTKIGCTLSLICLLFSLPCFLKLRSLRNRSAIKTHVQLFSALTGLYFFFLFGINVKTGFCTVITVLLHFFTIASGSWMSMEAANVYFMIVKPFLRKRLDRLLFITTLTGWGFPFLVLVVSLSWNTGAYTMSRSERLYCYLPPDQSMLFGVVLPLAVLLLFNAIIFILVGITLMQSLQRRLLSSSADEREEYKRLFRSATFLSVLMGLTWIFGFFTFGNPTSAVIFSLLFGFLNSFQGVCVSMMFCAMEKDVQYLVCRRFNLWWKYLCGVRNGDEPLYVAMHGRQQAAGDSQGTQHDGISIEA